MQYIIIKSFQWTTHMDVNIAKIFANMYDYYISILQFDCKMSFKFNVES